MNDVKIIAENKIAQNFLDRKTEKELESIKTMFEGYERVYCWILLDTNDVAHLVFFDEPLTTSDNPQKITSFYFER
ncbi:MAG: hypothetical protein KGV51_05870 [Moraxellaceae bacterium]|nr:hypothetical protein [Moraxellaceae bacterium]